MQKAPPGSVQPPLMGIADHGSSLKSTVTHSILVMFISICVQDVENTVVDLCPYLAM